MEIAGLQKLTLLDYPGKVACTVFLAGCNFRCPYCHNAELIDRILPPEMDSDELLAFLSRRKGLLDGVCVTGGEPTLRGQELKDLIGRIKALSFSVKLDTNGTRPDLLRELVREKLVDYVAMDIKNSPDRYAETAGIPSPALDAVRESVRFLLEGGVDYEFRTTVVRECSTTTPSWASARGSAGRNAISSSPSKTGTPSPCPACTPRQKKTWNAGAASWCRSARIRRYGECSVRRG